MKQVVRNKVSKKCKCLGVSGSCQVKTCWLQLTEFSASAKALKFKYQSSANARDFSTNKPYKYSKPKKRRKKMLYIEPSPSFCTASKYGPGTSTRRCKRSSADDCGTTCSSAGLCSSMCCGRGYNTQVEQTQHSCACKVKGIIVSCKRCNRTQEVHFCK